MDQYNRSYDAGCTCLGWWGLCAPHLSMNELPKSDSEMTRQIKVLAARPDDPASIPRTHMVEKKPTPEG